MGFRNSGWKLLAAGHCDESYWYEYRTISIFVHTIL